MSASVTDASKTHAAPDIARNLFFMSFSQGIMHFDIFYLALAA
jgi:hypothetical protein